MKRPLRIVLTGFSGTGKTKVARLVATRLGWQAVDTDDLIVQRAGKPIPAIFAHDGEDAFRRIEREALAGVCRQPRTVIGVGGGANVSGENRRIMAEGGFVVCLEARPETILKRLRPQLKRDPGARPMLAAPDPLGRIRELKALRAPFYALADHTVHTDGLSPEQVSDEVLRAWRQLSAIALAKEGRLAALAADPVVAAPTQPYHPPADATCVVRAASASYPVFVSWGALPDLGRRLAQASLGGRAFLIADANVHERWGAAAEEALRSAGFGVAVYTVPAGEASKTLETASSIYDWLVVQRAERAESACARRQAHAAADRRGHARARHRVLCRVLPVSALSRGQLRNPAADRAHRGHRGNATGRIAVPPRGPARALGAARAGARRLRCALRAQTLCDTAGAHDAGQGAGARRPGLARRG